MFYIGNCYILYPNRRGDWSLQYKSKTILITFRQSNRVVRGKHLLLASQYNVSITNEVYQIAAEHAFHVVIDMVCKYLKAKDLSNVAKVCKSWREAALHEKGLRCYDQKLRFPYDIDNLGNKLDIIPYVSLLIYNPAWEKSLSLPAHNYWSDSKGIEEEREQTYD